MSGKSAPAQPIPHSWTIDTWPVGVYPGSPSRARYIFRMHREALLTQGAVARVGRDLVFFGSNYHKWLERQRSNVADFKIAPNARPAA
jgi:hypothetical protein